MKELNPGGVHRRTIRAARRAPRLRLSCVPFALVRRVLSCLSNEP